MGALILFCALTMLKKEEHIQRINKAFHYIEQNLDSALSLTAVAEVAHYSAFHFHRLFRLMTGESLNQYINRKRLEKCASILFRHQEQSVAEIYLKYGFTSNSSFTRSFKKHYGMSPTDFRRLSPDGYSKIGITESKNGQNQAYFQKYLYSIDELIKWIIMNAKPEIKEVPDMTLAYVTQIGDPGLDEAFNKLIKWARPKGLMDDPEVKLLKVYHDSFKVTDAQKVRMSAAISVENPIKPDGEISPMKLSPGRCIVANFEITPDQFEKAWTSLFVWMNEHGYAKADIEPFEVYHNNFNEHPEKKCKVDMYIPVQ